jgi:integrase/recombinase XerC
MTPRRIVNWFGGIYRDLGMSGCSSHSGRRSFITNAARILPKSGGSLRDVMELAGHRALTTTERYIAGNREAQRKLIGLL